MPLIIHYDEDFLESYAMGRLEEGAVAEAEEHLLVCQQCQDRLEQVDDFIRAFRIASNNKRTSPSRISPPAPHSSAGAWLADWFGQSLSPGRVAGALAMAVLAIVLVAPRPHADGDPGAAEVASLSALRGADSPVVSAGSRLRLDLDAVGLDRSAYRVELADARGRQLWEASLPIVAGRIPAALPKRLNAGNYWVRLYDPDSGQIVREFGLWAR